MGVLNSDILAYAKNHPITKGVLCLVEDKLEKGLLYYKSKENCSKEKYLYWYPSLDSGLPIVNKPDKIHQALYMFHDMVHTCLYDPLPDCDKRTYLLGKMVGEVMAQLIADGLFADLLKQHYKEDYSYEKRYYLQMYQHLKHIDIQQLVTAISYFALFNDRRKLIALCDNREAKKWAHVYCNLYYKMFSADLWWNNEIYKQYAGKTFNYNEALCYKNNKKTKIETIEEGVNHNLKILQQVYEEDKGNGIQLAKELSNGKEFIYDFVTVNYKNTIDETVLGSIRASLR